MTASATAYSLATRPHGLRLRPHTLLLDTLLGAFLTVSGLKLVVGRLMREETCLQLVVGRRQDTLLAAASTGCATHANISRYLPSGSEDGESDSIEAVRRGANLLFAEHCDDPNGIHVNSRLVQNE